MPSFIDHPGIGKMMLLSHRCVNDFLKRKDCSLIKPAPQMDHPAGLEQPHYE